MVSCPRPVFGCILTRPETQMTVSGCLVRSGLAWPSCFDCLDSGDSRSELFDISALEYEQSCPQELAFFDVDAIGEAFLLQQADFVVIGLGHCKAVTNDLLFSRPLHCLAFGFLCRLDHCFSD